MWRHPLIHRTPNRLIKPLRVGGKVRVGGGDGKLPPWRYYIRLNLNLQTPNSVPSAGGGRRWGVLVQERHVFCGRLDDRSLDRTGPNPEACTLDLKDRLSLADSYERGITLPQPI
jgi:hypothetical protein